MEKKITDQIRKADLTKWKKIKVEYGTDFLDIAVPPNCVTLKMKRMACLTSSKDEILMALNRPIGSPTLPEIIRSKGKPADKLTVCITVSDITRPVPYKGENGILLPLVEIIEKLNK